MGVSGRFAPYLLTRPLCFQRIGVAILLSLLAASELPFSICHYRRVPEMLAHYSDLVSTRQLSEGKFDAELVHGGVLHIRNMQ